MYEITPLQIGNDAMMQKQDPSLGFATGRHSVMGTLALELRLGIGSSPSDIQSLELVETCKHTSAGDAAQDVCTSSLHQRHETFILHDLEEAVHGALVFHAASRSHHHSPPHGVCRSKFYLVNQSFNKRLYDVRQQKQR